MRRLIVEFATDAVAKVLNDTPVEKIESMDVLSFLRTGPDEVALLCKVRLKDPATKLEEVLGGRFDEIQVLERSREGLLCYLRGRRNAQDYGLRPADPQIPDAYPLAPYEIRDGRFRMTFLGSAKGVRRILRTLEGLGAPFRVISVMDARFLPDSPLARLTEKQRRVLLAAFRLGYYDVPRRVSSEELSKQLGIRAPTLVMHRRKAERSLLAAVIGEP